MQKFLKSVGITIEDDTVTFERDKNPDKNYVEEQPKEYKEPAELPVSDVKSLSEKYTNITSPDCIINSPLDSHIILNSGSGTGKTYTIIQRLIYILENGNVIKILLLITKYAIMCKKNKNGVDINGYNKSNLPLL